MNHERPPSVCVLGLGYIGLPTAAVIARAGLEVTGVDTSPQVVDAVRHGRAHIEEPGLEALVAATVKARQLTVANLPRAADVFLFAVPTPTDARHRPDLDCVFAAVEAVSPLLAAGNLLILESTCPIGTTALVRDRLAELRPDLAWPGRAERSNVAVAYCPERVLPGRALAELVANARSIGGLDERSADAAREFYRYFVTGECVTTDAATAEMVKLMENASRDVSIAFANEMSLVAERMGVNVWEAIALANRHPRVNILKPGPGVGGHCIAVDPWFLIGAAPDLTPLMRTARGVNDGKADHVIACAEAMLTRHPHARLACFGITFKPDVDDLRESPALAIVARLAKTHGDRIIVVDPHVRSLPPALESSGARLASFKDAADQCSLGLMLVDHAAFRDQGCFNFVASYDCRGAWQKGRPPSVANPIPRRGLAQAAA